MLLFKRVLFKNCIVFVISSPVLEILLHYLCVNDIQMLLLLTSRLWRGDNIGCDIDYYFYLIMMILLNNNNSADSVNNLFCICSLYCSLLAAKAGDRLSGYLYWSSLSQIQPLKAFCLRKTCVMGARVMRCNLKFTVAVPYAVAASSPSCAPALLTRAASLAACRCLLGENMLCPYGRGWSFYKAFSFLKSLFALSWVCVCVQLLHKPLFLFPFAFV